MGTGISRSFPKTSFGRGVGCSRYDLCGVAPKVGRALKETNPDIGVRC